ncbi:MAG: SpoIIIAH-like family protein [Clostridia bacterium]|nr:SpoIIIAH-like family protein [Clostridia bacterium]
MVKRKGLNMINKVKDYLNKIMNSSNLEEKEDKTDKMKKVNFIDKLKFKKLNSKSNKKINTEKVKDVALVVSAFVLIGIGYVNFSNNNRPKETVDKYAKSTNNIGDVELVSSNAVIVENSESNENVINTNNNNEENNIEKEGTNITDNNSDESIASANIDNKNQSVENNSNNSNNVNEENLAKIVNNDEVDKVAQEKEQETNATSNNVSDSKSYFIELKMERNDMYSKSLETYQKIVDSSTISSEQKSIAVQEIEKINKTKNSIEVAEELIKLKGFEDVVIYSNADTVSVIVRVATLSNTQVAQIQNIVSRELGVQVSNINISNK